LSLFRVLCAFLWQFASLLPGTSDAFHGSLDPSGVIFQRSEPF
jgi:hypothetical protein